jgi:uncharacterized protein (TIGR02145 family)
MLTLVAVSCKKDNDDETNPAKNNPYLNPDLKYGSVSDIDGNKYATIQIGNQVWMAENLKVSKYNDGAPIHDYNDYLAYKFPWKDVQGAYLYYNDRIAYEQPHGKLYNGIAVKSGKICPKGWHVPNYDEWDILIDYLGGEAIAGLRMKSTSGWAENGNGSNESGFSATPSGMGNVFFIQDNNETERFFYSKSFRGVGKYSEWWTSEWGTIGIHNYEDRTWWSSYLGSQAICIRCMKD